MASQIHPLVVTHELQQTYTGRLKGNTTSAVTELTGSRPSIDDMVQIQTSPQQPNPPSHIWHANKSLAVPETDIVSHVFAKYNNIDIDAPLFIDAKKPWKFVTARQARSTVRQIAAGLKNHGLVQGDGVSIHSYNNVLYPLLWLGIIATRGATVSGANPAYSTAELLHHFKITRTRFVIVHVDIFDIVVNAAVTAGIDVENIFVVDDNVVLQNITPPGSPTESTGSINGGLHNVRSISDLLDKGEVDWDTLSNGRGSKQKPALYAITSGTTGLPKAAAIPHQYLVAQSVTIEDQFKGRKNKIVQLMCLPVFHAFAAPLALCLPLRTGMPTYFLPRFKTDDYLEAISRFSITDTAIVPPIVTQLLSLNQDQYVKLKSLRYLLCAGAPMNPEVQARLYDFLSPDVIIGQVWGATEVGWITSFQASEKDTSGSVGRLISNTQLKIIDEATGKVVIEEGKHGEACIRSPSMMLRYEGNPEASLGAVDEEGFYHTGDKVYIKEGKVFVCSRIKDTMKVNGWQVSPEELEEIVTRHSKVSDCAVIGVAVKDRVGLDQTRPRAYVVLKKDRNVSAEEIQDFVAAQVIGYKRLTGGVRFISQIPRNPTGKILRRLLPIDQI